MTGGPHAGGSSEVEPLDGLDVVRVRAANPGLLTLSGTNTWVVGRDPAWVVDPGPALPAHLDAVAGVVTARGGAGGIALTHGHADHAEAVAPLRERLGGERVELGSGPLEALPLPGHADDHVVFLWGGACCTGDAVLGEGSVFVAGDMAGYLDGLRALRAREPRVLCPGHGPPVWEAAAKLDAYVAHRLERERRLLDALAAGLRSDDELLDAAWSDAPPMLRPASLLTMRSHLRKLAAEDRLPPDVTVPPREDLPAI